MKYMKWLSSCMVLLAVGACSSSHKTAITPALDASRDTQGALDGGVIVDSSADAGVIDVSGDREIDGLVDALHDGTPFSEAGHDITDTPTFDPVDSADGEADGEAVSAVDALADGSINGEAGSGTDTETYDASRLVAEITRAIEASSCPDSCPMTTVTANPGQARASSQGQRILLIDDGIVFTAATSYASRTLAFLRVEEDGSYREYTPSFDMPAEAYQILKKIDEASPPLRQNDLNLAQPFADKFLDKFPETWAAHGSDIQAFLTEKLPDAQFVISEDQLNSPMPCLVLDAGSAAAEWQKYEERLATMQNTVVEAITKYGVNYVHLSWGLEHSSVVDSFERQCGRSPSREVTNRILEMYVGLFRAITALTSPSANGQAQPVMLFQAGAPASQPGDFLLDCTDISGRIRVMSASYSGYEVPRGGSHDYSLLSAQEQVGMACNDVYMVMGYAGIFDQPREKYFQSFFLGLGPAPKQTWPATPSFANPIALAHFICLAKRYPQESTASWASRLTNSWSKPILDPILYDEFPVDTTARTIQ
jgi:hypothetical protein